MTGEMNFNFYAQEPRPVACAVIYGTQPLSAFTSHELWKERRMLQIAVPLDQPGDAASLRGHIAKIDDELRSRGLQP